MPAISLSEIYAKVDDTEYVGVDAWKDFAADVNQLIMNAVGFNDDDTIWFTLASILQKEMDIAEAQIREHLPELLEA